MTARTYAFILFSLTILVLYFSVACCAEPVAPKIADAWSGRVSSANAAEFERSRGVVRSAAEFKRLWSLAFPGQKVPKIDFDKSIVLTAVAQTSFVALRFERKETELVTNVTVSADLTSDYSVTLVVAPSAGVRKVDGRPL